VRAAAFVRVGEVFLGSGSHAPRSEDCVPANQKQDEEMKSVGGRRTLRPGDVVVVRSAEEILATLDEQACANGLPFMPEMLRYAGRQFTVSRRIEKICNNVDSAHTPSRRMRTTVHLDDLRCDGSAHGGCQLACRLLWKEEWLRPADSPITTVDGDDKSTDELDSLSRASTTTVRQVEGESLETFKCQATEIVAASEPLNRFDPRQFVREVRGGNISFSHLIAVVMRTAWFKGLRVLGVRQMLPLNLTDAAVDVADPIDLQPGDLVEVRSREEIARTLNQSGRNRGLLFTPEMLRYTGRRFRVRSRVTRLVDERTGNMIEIANDCVVLDGVTCPGEDGCWAFLFCPQRHFPFWREAWLRRVDDKRQEAVD
jgi:hypothetical protein